MTSERAFTLLELTVVMAIVGLAAGILIPRLTDLGALTLDASARRLADDLTLARDRAVLRGRPAHLRLDLDLGRWAEDGGGITMLPAGMRVRSVSANGRPPVGAGTVVVDLEPAGDTFPARIDLADERGRVASVVLAPAAARARVMR
jgi:type II secretion system protein H